MLDSLAWYNDLHHDCRVFQDVEMQTWRRRRRRTGSLEVEVSGPQGVLSLSFPAGGGAALLETAGGAPKPCSVQVDRDQRRPWVVRESISVIQRNSTESSGESREEGLRCMMSCIHSDTALSDV